MTLGATSVPAGSLLVFNGYPNPDRVIAVNPATGAVIASLALAGNYDLTAGVYDAASGHLFVTEHNPRATTWSRSTRPPARRSPRCAVPLQPAELAGPGHRPGHRQPVAGQHNSGSDMVETHPRRACEVRRVDLAARASTRTRSPGWPSPPTAACCVASTQGEVYRVDTARSTAPPCPPPRSTQVIAQRRQRRGRQRARRPRPTSAR